MGALIATLFTVIAVAISSFAISGQLSTRVAVAPNAPESKPAASGCGGTCRSNCNEDETGSGTSGCSEGQYCCNSNGGANPTTPPTDSNSCAGPLSAEICKNKSVGDTVCVHNTLRCSRTTGTNCSAYDTGVQCEDFAVVTPEPTNTEVSAVTVVQDSCGKGMVCSNKASFVCEDMGGEATQCTNSLGVIGKCCSPTGAIPTTSPTQKPTATITPTCVKDGGTFKDGVPCCTADYVKVVTPYGAYCGKKGVCTSGEKKCQVGANDIYFEYLCDSSGHFQQNKRCDFGCEGNSCKTGGCVAGQTRCDPARPNELETCSGTAWSGKSCDNGCEIISSIKAQCKTISGCTNPVGVLNDHICNNAGGYNYCSPDGKWYSRKCESEKPGSVCVSGQCVLPSPTASVNAQLGNTSIDTPTVKIIGIGDRCDDNTPCSTGFCYAGNQVLGGSPFDSTKTCHVNSIEVMDETQKDLATNTAIGEAAILTAVVAAPVVADVIAIAAAGGGVSALPLAATSYATAALSSLPAWTGTAVTVASTLPGAYYAGKCLYGECTQEEQMAAFMTGVGIQEILNQQMIESAASYKSSFTSSNGFTVPSSGEIEIGLLSPHEPGYNLNTVPRLKEIMDKGGVLDPIEITVFDGKIFTVDGANRVTATLQSGSNTISFINTPFRELSQTKRSMIEIINDGNGAFFGRTIPNDYTNFPAAYEFWNDTIR